MKRSFKLMDLGCAHCAMKMEDAVKKIEGVKSASVSFMMQKLSIEAEEEAFEEILDKAQKAITRIERKCVIER